jgi:predicted N-formylglutamate amidohydrolase
MTEAFTVLGDPAAPILIISDHASNHVPAGIDLGVPPEVMTQHMAIDIGVAAVAALLVEQGDCCAILGGVSRLVIDYNRAPGDDGFLPLVSDGHRIPGNEHADVDDLLARFYNPYHEEAARLVAGPQRPFILSLHSFTPQLQTRPEEARPWEIGVLYNEDDRAARIAIPLLEQAGLIVGEQEPYSGKTLNASMDRHAEAHGHPYLGVELRQDLISEPDGQRRFAEILAPILRTCHEHFAGK